MSSVVGRHAEGLAEAERLWAEVSLWLRERLNETNFRTWFGGAEAGELTTDSFVVAVPNDFTRDWIERQYRGAIEAGVRKALGEERDVRLVVRESRAEDPPLEPRRRRRLEDLNPKYTFDSFTIGSSNRFAHAAVRAVAEAPARAYNPLFIYGGTGLGKTHLLQAIAQFLGEHAPELTVRYVTSETFLNDFINLLRDKRIEGFRKRYRYYDVLLVDDIQFLQHKERIQEEFFHTFNALYGAGRQVVISSDRLPRDIPTLESRLRSRFEWGLIVDIQPPDLETRIAILHEKAKTDRIDVPDAEVLTFIASRISTNIRELEGALTRVVAFSALSGRAMSVQLAQEILKDVFAQGEPPELSIERIQEMVSERFDVSVQDLTGHRRSRAIAYPRHVAMYLCRELTDSSLPGIGRQFGNRDHTTVMYATSKVAKLIREDQEAHNLVRDLVARIKQAQ